MFEGDTSKVARLEERVAEHLGFSQVLTEGTLHLVADQVRRFTGLLDVHPEFDHVQEQLQKVLVLGVPSLNGEGQEGFAVFNR